MQKNFNLKTYRPGITIPQDTFYILNKGNNAGKPLKQPCPNCYMLTAATEADYNYWYWLCWGLWQSRSFEQYIWGSVIPTIRIGNVARVLHAGDDRIGNRPEAKRKAVESLISLSAYINTLERKYNALHQLQIAIARQLLHC
jgi:hypothetical protein